MQVGRNGILEPQSLSSVTGRLALLFALWAMPSGCCEKTSDGPLVSSDSADGSVFSVSLEAGADTGLDPSLQALLDPPDGAVLPDEPLGGKGDGEIIEVKTSVEHARVADASSVVKAMIPGFRSCARTGLKDTPNLAGEVLVRVDLMPNGEFRVKESKSSKGDIPDSICQCVGARLAVGQVEPVKGRASLLVRVGLRKRSP